MLRLFNTAESRILICLKVSFSAISAKDSMQSGKVVYGTSTMVKLRFRQPSYKKMKSRLKNSADLMFKPNLVQSKQLKHARGKI